MLPQLFPIPTAAALVGILHMSAPDHWVTLCILARKSSWSKALLGLGILTSGGHVLLSMVLGLGIVYLRLIFSAELSSIITSGTGLAMLVVGLGYGIKTLLTAKHDDFEKRGQSGIRRGQNIWTGIDLLRGFGGALSPDLSILPIFLLAVSLGLGFIFDAAVIFALAFRSYLGPVGPCRINRNSQGHDQGPC